MGVGKLFESFSGKTIAPKKERNDRKASWYQCQCSGSSQIPCQDDLNYYKFLSLYKTMRRNRRTELFVYDTENGIETVKYLGKYINLDGFTSITQLPNGELFCYGNWDYGITLIIDRTYEVRMLPSGTNCHSSSTLYFENSIYCFGGYKNGTFFTLSRKFDLENNRWINLPRLPIADYSCHSVVINRNILISGYKHHKLCIYSTEINSFSMIPYEFARDKRKFLINTGRLYLIEWDAGDGLIYESEDEYHWKSIAKSGKLYAGYQMYCLYNKEKIYITTSYDDYYYQFDLEKKVVCEINVT